VKSHTPRKEIARELGLTLEDVKKSVERERWRLRKNS
jgi:predicted transcriptional regulator